MLRSARAFFGCLPLLFTLAVVAPWSNASAQVTDLYIWGCWPDHQDSELLGYWCGGREDSQHPDISPFVVEVVALGGPFVPTEFTVTGPANIIISPDMSGDQYQWGDPFMGDAYVVWVEFTGYGDVTFSASCGGHSDDVHFTVIDHELYPGACSQFRMISKCDTLEAPPPIVCDGSTLCLVATGWDTEHALCDNFEWTIVSGNGQIIGDPVGREAQVLLHGPVPVVVRVSTGEPIGAESTQRTFSFDVSPVDLDIDSDNNNGFESPSGTAAEEAIENDPTKPGKLMFVNQVDDDDDSVPGYADGVDEVNNGSGGSNAWFVPVEILVPANDIAHTTIRFDYSASDPAGIKREPGPPTDLGTEWKPDVLGRFRLWTKDAIENRSSDVFPNGDYIAPGTYQLSDFQAAGLLTNNQFSGWMTLYVEAVKRSPAQGADILKIYVEQTSTSGDCIRSGEDQVRFTAAELEVHDLRHWGPKMNPDGSAGITNNDLEAEISNSTVGGAITDGASICLLRVRPADIAWNLLPNPTIEVERAPLGSILFPPYLPSETEDSIVGTVWQPTMAAGNVVLPALPMPWPLPATAASSVTLSGGKALYVPPETYSDMLWSGFSDPENHTLVPGTNAIQTRMNFSVKLGVQWVGGTNFLLRRPPLVLVHGIMSGPETWGSFWHEPTSGFPETEGPLTRLYKVNYGPTSHRGYDENFGAVAKMIEGALREYRGAIDSAVPGVPAHATKVNFQGIRFAATRADVVGHSMGGQVTRWYTADFATNYIEIMRGGQWPTLKVARHQPSADINSPEEDGKWPYRRDDNFGAGAIRRFATMGSPFRGSPLASVPKGILEPAPDKVDALRLWAISGGMPPNLKDHLWPPPLGTSTLLNYSAPTCVNDLDLGSNALYVLTNRVNEIPGYELINFTTSYPQGHQQVRWFALGGKSTQLAGNNSTNWIEWGVLTLVALVDHFNGNNGLQFLPYTSYILAQADVAADNSDLLVSLTSQFKGWPAAANTQVYHLHTHSAPLPGNNETSSEFMNRDIIKLLRAFPEGITLEGQFEPNGAVSTTATGRTFLPLTTAP